MEQLKQPKDKISVCIAAFNDENTVAEVIARSARAVSSLPFDFEILVVDDCSRDNTAKVLAGLSSRLGYLKIIAHKENKGYGATISELLYASKGEFAFTLPGDLQIPPEEIIKLLPWMDKYDIVIGVRNPRHDPFLRKVNSFIYNTVIRLLFLTGTTDVNSSKLIRRKVIDNIDLKSDGPFIDAELCAKALRKGFKIKEVQIKHSERLYGCPSGDKLPIMWKAFRETISMIGKI